MTIEIKNGTFKVISDVTAPVCSVEKDENGDVVGTYIFGTSPEGKLTTTQFLANSIADDGRLVFSRLVDTSKDTCKDNLKTCYGDAVATAAKFEEKAIEMLVARNNAEAARQASIDMLFMGSEQ